MIGGVIADLVAFYQRAAHQAGIAFHILAHIEERGMDMVVR